MTKSLLGRCTKISGHMYNKLSGVVLCWGRGQFTPKPRPCPQMWHEALFDERTTSTYRSKRGILCPSKCAPPLAQLTMLPRPTSRLGRRHLHPCLTPLAGPRYSASSTRQSALSAPCFLFGGIAPKYFSRTAPENLFCYVTVECTTAVCMCFIRLQINKF